jgi:hypothetical protein
MTKPNWTFVDLVSVDAKPDGLWTLALDFASGSRLLRFRVVDKDEQDKGVSTTWSLSAGASCGPNGEPRSTTQSSLLCSAAPPGALIAKLGGSSADIPDPAQTTAPYGSKRVFAVGAYCIAALASTESGPLFLTMNDCAEGFKNHAGQLHVRIEEAPI